jgi:poly-beta-1,6-N-acetyl-D-glucosamine synthase
MKTNYVLITPAHNEEKFIEETIKSVVAQTIRPKKWLILDDGSTDKTGEIIKRYEAKHDFIVYYKVPPLEAESYYARRIIVFLLGYEKVKNENYDFIATLDADLSLEATYYENILGEFDKNPKLGIASGFYTDKVKGEFQAPVRDPDEISTPGGLQVFRSECFKAIGGYSVLKYGSSDTLAGIMARMKGWQTRHFPQYQAIHHRPVGTGNGSNILTVKYREGKAEYAVGYHPLFVLAKAVRRFFWEKPVLLASPCFLAGFLSRYLIGKKRDVPDEVVEFVRKEQIRRILSWRPKSLKGVSKQTV